MSSDKKLNLPQRISQTCRYRGLFFNSVSNNPAGTSLLAPPWLSERTIHVLHVRPEQRDACQMRDSGAPVVR
eukprot:3599500-Pleurochrysis_carterae.AAC.1